MKSAGQLFLGLLTALGSIALVIAAASLSILENGQETAFLGSFSPTAPASTLAAGTTAPTATQAGTATSTPIPPTRCPIPTGWTQYIVQSGDSLEIIAERFKQPADLIRQKNCLISDTLLPDTTLYLPISVPTKTVPPVLPTLAPTETITPTFTVVACQPPPYGWVLYSVKSGEYLFRLAQAFGVTVDQIVVANCLTSLTIYPNQRLYLPNVATRTPVIVPTRVPTSTPVPPTATRIPPTATTAVVVPPTPETPPVVETTMPVVETPTVPPVSPTDEKNLPSTSRDTAPGAAGTDPAVQ